MIDPPKTTPVPGIVQASSEALGKVPKPAQVGDKNIAPTTSAEQDLGTAGQRHINRVWEYTQACVAIMVTSATLIVAGRLAFEKDGGTAAFLLLSNVFFMVMGMYFQRTNHTKIGGVEEKHR